MRKTAFGGLALVAAITALGQQPAPSPDRESAAAGGTGWRCEVMSREEMLFCQAAKQGGARGVRNNLCESVSAETIERCLVQQESVSSDPANEFRDREDTRAARG
jgi:hypothetical protein